eukprot:c22373_g1_i3 orf=510-1004(+)
MAGQGTKQGEGVPTEPAIGVPYAYPPMPAQTVTVPPYQQAPFQYYSHDNPYQAGMIPPNAIFDIPRSIPLGETVYADTPAPFECPNCGKPGVTVVKSKPSLAACVACMMSLVGVCFLCPGLDCLWHKEHYCPNCGQKVADFRKSDPCAIVDKTQWFQPSFAVPA